jgi:hypothetical protein
MDPSSRTLGGGFKSGTQRRPGLWNRDVEPMPSTDSSDGADIQPIATSKSVIRGRLMEGYLVHVGTPLHIDRSKVVKGERLVHVSLSLPLLCSARYHITPEVAW